MLGPQGLLALLLFSCTQGIIVQVIDNTVICPTDVATFWCSDNRGILNWDIDSRIGLVSIPFSPGNLNNKTVTLGSSQIEAQVTYTIDSFINATVTITMASSLSRTTVTCNGESLVMNLSTTDIYLSSAQLILTSLTNNIGLYNFNFKLSPNLLITEEYAVTVSPSPPYGGHVITSSGSTATAMLVFQNDVKHNLTIHFIDCPERLTTTITIIPDLCPDQDQNKMYIYYQNGTQFLCTNSTDNYNTGCSFYMPKTSETACNNMVTTNVPVNTNNSDMVNTSDSDMIVSTTTGITSVYPGEGNFSIDLSAIVITIVFIIILSAIAAIIATFLVRLRVLKKKKKLSTEQRTQVESSDVTYQYLSHKQSQGHKYNTSSVMQFNQDDQYSSLKYKKPLPSSRGEYGILNNATSSTSHKKRFQPSEEEYNTVSTDMHSKTTMKESSGYGSVESKKHAVSGVSNKCSLSSDKQHNKTKKLAYAHVDASDPGGTAVPEVIHIRTKYTDINVTGRPEDKTLNLDTLLIQLNLISKDFRLLGSVAGISPEILDKITDSCADSYDGLVEVCDAWLDKCRREKTTPTWSAVAEILSLIGRDQMSQDIMQVYITGKLPVQVDMNSLDIQGEACLPLPPPVPHHKEEEVEEVALMTVTPVMTSWLLSETTMDQPPPIPKKFYNQKEEEFNDVRPERPPKIGMKDQQRKPVLPSERNNTIEVLPSLPPRPFNN